MTPNRIEGLVKTVRAHEVELCTCAGWVVVGTFQDTIMRMLEELGDLPMGSYCVSGQYYTDAKGLYQPVPTGKTIIYKQVPETVTFFVLQRDTESALVDLNARLDLANKTIADAKAELQKKLDAMKAEYEKATDLLKKGLKEAEEALKHATSGTEQEKLQKRIKALEDERDQLGGTIEQLKKDLDESQRERFGVRRLDLTEDVA